MHNNKRRQNGMNGGNGGGQNRHNNRPRRFGGGGGRNGGGDDSANAARSRRNATQSREKYNNMARDAMASGDRVLAEYYLQHADHYYRILLSLPQEEVRQPYPQQQGAFAEEGNTGATPENAPESGNYTAADAPAESPASALPSFITQPLPHENLQD
jgi:hypothetical protein